MWMSRPLGLERTRVREPNEAVSGALIAEEVPIQGGMIPKQEKRGSRCQPFFWEVWPCGGARHRLRETFS